jgi:hypothetical protein
MSTEWRGMTPEQKAKHENACKIDKERFNKDMKEYSANKKAEELKNPKKAPAPDSKVKGKKEAATSKSATKKDTKLLGKKAKPS